MHEGVLGAHEGIGKGVRAPPLSSVRPELVDPKGGDSQRLHFL
ncbi:hypothetical protein SFOMI_0731 [Sphingobium fuliginis]|uniref:Uncharacterized protein n=1 Tax=Sphingobium fuliginis (strain ATCC 27551) TaxID=336203 RepID=A0A292ZAP9_SPHSA|nr:hypothetical protein SFOMI_0731 [Sphingobium fuliginis]